MKGTNGGARVLTVSAQHLANTNSLEVVIDLPKGLPAKLPRSLNKTRGQGDITFTKWATYSEKDGRLVLLMDLTLPPIPPGSETEAMKQKRNRGGGGGHTPLHLPVDPF